MQHFFTCIALLTIGLYSADNTFALTVNVVTTNVFCNGGNNGTATAIVSPSTGYYLYLWSNGATTSSITGLSAGNYWVKVTTPGGNPVKKNFTITQPKKLKLKSQRSNVLCNGNCSGSIWLSASGGVLPYSFAWSNGSTASTRTNLCAGLYGATVTDGNGCTAAIATLITQPSPITITPTLVHVSCADACNGSISLSVTGGAVSYTFQWNTGQTTSTIANLCVGAYIVTVTNANGCTVSNAFQINNSQPLVVNYTTSDVTCYGQCNGHAETIVIGGVVPYTYSWSNIATTPNITNLCAGTYSLTVTDANGCTAGINAVINQPTPMAINATSSEANDGCNGTASVTVSGGSSPYTVSWSDGGVGFARSGLCGGIYSFTLTDFYGCSISSVVSVNESDSEPPLVLDLEGTTTFCDCTGSIVASVYGGTAPYTFSWYDGATNSSISNLCSGAYSVTVTDFSGNTVSDVMTITGAAGPALSVSTTSSCISACTGTAIATVTGGTPGYVFQWDNGATNAFIEGLCTGIYTVTVADALGCTVSQSGTVEVGCRTTEENIIKEKFTVQPNPFVTNTTITFFAVTDGKAVLEIFSVNGAKALVAFDGLVEAGKMYSIVIDGSELPDAVYVYRLITQDQTITGNIVKMR